MNIEADILIIGSGPVGATFARTLNQGNPDLKIKMVELGPQISEIAGQHVKNIKDKDAMEKAQILSQGPKKQPYPMISVPERAEAVRRGDLSSDYLARAGTHLVSETKEDLLENDMPALSFSTNIGGMGSHWTCACPTPGNAERIPFIPENEMNVALEKAKEILNVSQDAFPPNPQGDLILKTLSQTLGDTHSPGRQPQPMPLACGKDSEGNRYWSASDTILGDTLMHPNFEIISETLCRSLIVDGKTVIGAEVENMNTGKKYQIHAHKVIVAADALRTPQILWASNIRPEALGHYLNEHPFIFTFVELFSEKSEDAKGDKKPGDPTVGVFWVPFDAPNHPYHGQIMHMDLSPMKTKVEDPDKHIVGLGWGCLKEARFEDAVTFSETETDYLGMPKMKIDFTYTDKDIQEMNAAKKIQAKVASAFGKTLKDGEQTVMPPGSSLHYEGTTRMGTQDDGTSVCNTYSQVWGYDNLYVGGNGVIPLATTSNPTLTSVALAIRACEQILKE